MARVSLGRRPALLLVRSLPLLAFAAAAVVGGVLTLVSLLGTPAVDIGFFRVNDQDALALFVGNGLYHDPSGAGYTGTLYTPGLPALIAVLDHVRLWAGWGVLINVVAGAGLGTLVGAAAHRAAGQRGPLALARAAGIGGLAVWLATSVVGELYLPWTDGLAWTLALGGIVCIAGSRESRRRQLAAVALLSAAFWVKQPAVIASLAVTVWLVIAAARGERSRRTVVAFVLSLVATNLAILGVLELVSGGWEFFYNFVLPTREVRTTGLRQFGSDVRQALLAPLLVAAGLAAASLLGRSRRDGEPLGLDALLVVFLVIGVPAALYFRTKQGGALNQYLGVAWALALLGARAWGRAQRQAGGGLVADVVVAAALAAAVAATAARDYHLDLRQLRVKYDQSVPASLRALARRHSVLHPYYSDLNATTIHAVFPNADTIADLLAAGSQPRALVRDLLARRFDYAVTYSAGLGAGAFAYLQTYSSAYGHREENYLWKLDQVIRAGYEAAPSLPAGVMRRRPGADAAAGLARCFGPFRLAGATFEILHGGGLWCRDASAAREGITMAGSPARMSELVSERDVLPSGSVVVDAPPTRASFSVALAGGSAGWDVSGERTSRGWRVSVASPGTPPTSTLVRGIGGRLELRFAAAGSAPISIAGRSAVRLGVLGHGQRGRLQLWGSGGERVHFDVSRLRTH